MPNWAEAQSMAQTITAIPMLDNMTPLRWSLENKIEFAMKIPREFPRTSELER